MNDFGQNFTTVRRSCDADDIWVHKTEPAWIVRYDNMYQAYKVKDYELPIRKEKPVWAHDNRRLGHADYGFESLEDAMRAIENCKTSQ